MSTGLFNFKLSDIIFNIIKLTKIMPKKISGSSFASNEHEVAVPTKFKTSSLVKFLVLLLIIVIGGFFWSFNNYLNYKKQVARLSTAEGQQELVKKETAGLVEKVGRHIVLPVGEEPTVATVMDAVGLAKDQPFYKDAQNGDKVLIYVQAQKAIIYSETKDILVNVGPVYIDQKQKTPEKTAPVAEPVEESKTE